MALIIGAGLAFAAFSQRKATTTTINPSSSPLLSKDGPGKDTAVHAGPAHDTTPTPTSSLTPAVSNPSHPVTALAKPFATLNTHTVSLSGNTTMDSTCSSVSGASCYIQASMGGSVVILSDTKTMTDTGADFIWDAKKLSPGSWSIQAVASKDGQRSLSDPQTLTVNP